jgi:sulfite exporter TauE/SafE
MEFIAAFMLGLLSAPHCIAMCGGIAGALLMHTPAASTINSANVIVSTRRQSAISDALTLGSGKILGYMLLGAAAGSSGYLIGEVHTSLFTALRALAGLLLIGLGLYTAGWWLGLQHLEKAAYRLWQPVLLRFRQLDLSKTSHKLMAGLLWGLLPCGIVYSVLGMALASGNVLSGALIMLLFGLGTLPFVLSSGGLVQISLPWLGNTRVKQTVGLVLIIFGAISVSMALGHGQQNG